jgi:hypothetical protein
MMGAAPSPQSTVHRFIRSARAHIKSAFKRPAATSKPERKPERIFLLLTLGADAIAAAALGIGQLYLLQTLFATVGAGILAAIGVANFWALNAVRRDSPSWPRDAVIAQIFMLLLAVFVIIEVLRDPPINWVVFGISLGAGLIAAGWILVLWDRQAEKWTNAAKIITVLASFTGLLQFWAQNYYLPETSAPLVDVSTELTPQTKTGSVIHLSAKVTLHNSSKISVNVAGALMRVTAYPETMPPRQEAPDVCQKYQEPPPAAPTPPPPPRQCLEGDLDLSGINLDSDFRANPTPAIYAQLLYAGLLMPGPGQFLMPGESETFQREVDMEYPKFRLARLSASAIFLPERTIADTRSCYGTTASASTDPRTFSREASITLQWSDERYVPAVSPLAMANYLCVNYEIAPRSIIERLIGNRLVVTVHLMLNDPQEPGNEYPQLQAGLITARGDSVDKKIEQANPLVSDTDVSSEYAPGEKYPPDAKEPKS